MKMKFASKFLAIWTIICLLATSGGVGSPFLLKANALYIQTASIAYINGNDLKIQYNLDTEAGTNVSIKYAITLANASLIPASDLLTLSATSDSVLAFGSESVSSGSYHGDFIVPLTNAALTDGRAYKLQLVLTEAPGNSFVTELKFYKGGLVELPTIDKRYKDGFKFSLKSNIPSLIYAGAYPYLVTQQPPSYVDIKEGTNVGGHFVTAVQANQTAYIAVRNLNAGVAYKSDFVLLDAFGNLHLNAGESIYSEVAANTIGTGIVSGSYVHTSATYNSDYVKVFFDAPLDSPHAYDMANYELSVIANGTTTVLTPYADYSLTPLGDALSFNITDAGLAKYSSLITSYSGVIRVVVKNTNSFEPQIEVTNASIDIVVNQGQLTNNQPRVAFRNVYLAEPGQTDAYSDNVYTVNLEGNTTTGDAFSNLVVQVGHGKGPLFGNIEKTLSNGLDYTASFANNIMVFALTSAGESKLSTVTDPVLRLGNSSSLGVTAYDSDNGFAYIETPSVVNTLNCLTVDQRPVASFAPDTLSYANVPIGFKHGSQISRAYDACLIAAVPANSKACYEIGYDNNSQQHQVKVISEAGTSRTYTLGLVTNQISLKSLKVNNTSVNGFYNNMGTAYAVIPKEVTAPTIAIQFENEDMVLNVNVIVTETGSLPGTKTLTYTSNLGNSPSAVQTFTLVLNTEQTTPTTPSRDTNASGGGGGAVGTSSAAVANNETPQIGNINSSLTPSASSETVINNLNSLNSLVSANNGGNLTETMKGINSVLDSLNKWMSPSATGANSNTTPEVQSKIAEDLAVLTKSVASKLLSAGTSPSEVGNFVNALSQARTNLQTNTASLDVGVETLVNQSFRQASTLTLSGTTKEGQTAVEVGQGEIKTLLDQQKTAKASFEKILNTYFAEGSRTLDTSVVVRVATNVVSGEPSTVRVGFIQELGQLLTQAGSSGVTVTSGGTFLHVSTQDLMTDNKTEIQMHVQPATGNQPRFVTFDMNQNGQPMEQFRQPLTIGFDLTSFGFKLTDANALAVFRLNETTQQYEPMGGQVNAITGVIQVPRSGLSQYTVMKSTKTFSDADQSWAKAEIYAALNKGIVAYGDKFEPKSLITRGEFASWIAKAYGLKSSGKALPFKDVDKTSPYYDAIAAVYEQGIIGGKTKKSFEPKGSLTVEEMAVILGKALVKFDNKNTGNKVVSKHLAALKASGTSDWATNDMALIQELGLTTQQGYASSKGFVSKEFAAAALMKAYQS